MKQHGGFTSSLRLYHRRHIITAIQHDGIPGSRKRIHVSILVPFILFEICLILERHGNKTTNKRKTGGLYQVRRHDEVTEIK